MIENPSKSDTLFLFLFPTTILSAVVIVLSIKIVQLKKSVNTSNSPGTTIKSCLEQHNLDDTCRIECTYN